MKQHPEDIDVIIPPLEEEIRTDRLLMRSARGEDAKVIFSKYTDNVIARWGGEKPGSSGEIKAGIFETRKKIDEKHKTLLDLVAFDKKNTNRLIGRCGIFPTEGKPLEYHVMLWVAPNERKQNFGIEMLQSLIAWAKNHRNVIHHLTFPVTDGNEASKKLIHKAVLGASARNVMRTRTETVGDEQKTVKDYLIPLD